MGVPTPTPLGHQTESVTTKPTGVLPVPRSLVWPPAVSRWEPSPSWSERPTTASSPTSASACPIGFGLTLEKQLRR